MELQLQAATSKLNKTQVTPIRKVQPIRGEGEGGVEQDMTFKGKNYKIKQEVANQTPKYSAKTRYCSQNFTEIKLTQLQIKLLLCYCRDILTSNMLLQASCPLRISTLQPPADRRTTSAVVPCAAMPRT